MAVGGRGVVGRGVAEDEAVSGGVGLDQVIYPGVGQARSSLAFISSVKLASSIGGHVDPGAHARGESVRAVGASVARLPPVGRGHGFRLGRYRRRSATSGRRQ